MPNNIESHQSKLLDQMKINLQADKDKSINEPKMMNVKPKQSKVKVGMEINKEEYKGKLKH